MLILKLRRHDIITGREQAAQFNVLIDYKNRQLVWPETQPKTREWHKILSTHKRNLLPRKPHLEHQQDVQRRERLLEIEIASEPKRLRVNETSAASTNPETNPESGSKLQTGLNNVQRPREIIKRTQKTEQQNSYRAMEAELQNQVRPPPLGKKARKAKEEPEQKPQIDICGISGSAFYLNLRNKDNTFFTTSLYEINRIL